MALRPGIRQILRGRVRRGRRRHLVPPDQQRRPETDGQLGRQAREQDVTLEPVAVAGDDERQGRD